MASKVDIFNLALSNIAHKANIADPNEVSAEANHCRRFYPIALSSILESFEWTFATRRTVLASVVHDSTSWLYAYAVPNLCVAPRAIMPPGYIDDSQCQDYAVEAASDGSAIIYTNQAGAILRYTTMVEDTTKFTPKFVTALSFALAALLCGPIPKDGNKRKEMEQLADLYLGEAQASNANSGQKTSSYENFIPSGVKARR